MARPRWRMAGWVAVIALVGCAKAPVREAATGSAGEPPAVNDGGYVPSEGASLTWGETGTAAAVPRSGMDLWGRVRAGMKLGRKTDGRVDAYARNLARDRRYLVKLADGARPFLQVVLAEIERRGLPAELALLPQVESRYNPAATSPKAAAGMWQFIPSTGAGMGLKQNAGYDGRRDLLASTRAALDYLEQLHRRLGGEWELALAAYNCGPGRVEAAQASNRAQGRGTDFWSLHLPAETENYVPALLAVARLVATPEQYGLALPAVPDAPQLEVVVGEQPLELATVAQAGRMDIRDLQRLNAGLKQGRTGDAGLGVLVPAGVGQQVSAGLQGARVVPAVVHPNGRPAVSAPEKDEAVGKEIAYQVQAGDSLGLLARRFGVSVGELREWNAGAADGLGAGETLRVFPRVLAPEAGKEMQSAERDGSPVQYGFSIIRGLASAG